MSKLLKLRLSFILLIVGIGLIPTAFLAKGYFIDQVPANTGDILLTIKDEASTYITEEFKGLGIPEILPKIKEDEIAQLALGAARIRPIPEFLRFIKNETITNFPPIINGSKTAREIDNVINLLHSENGTDIKVARDQFFNNFTFQDDYDTPLEGISELMTPGSTLNYSEAAIIRLLVGRTYNNKDYPGLLTDLIYGTGLLDWLNFYSLAESEPKNGTNKKLIQIVYNCTWESGQLQNLSAYIKSYLWNTILKNYYDSKGITNPAEFEFYAQWANSSFYSDDRIDLDVLSDIINQPLEGIEAGYPDPTDISLSSARRVWNSSCWFSFLNDTGFQIWQYIETSEDLDAYFPLNVTLGITNDQIDMVNSWLFNPVKNWIVPKIIEYPEPYGFNLNMTEYSELLVYEQWANGTVIPEGIDLALDYKGFEAGIPIKTNISMKITSEFFNKKNNSSFIHKLGILKWVDAAEGDTTSRNELKSIFDLNDLQLDLTLDWLFTTLRYNITPGLLWSSLRIQMISLAKIIFYRQWANGTIYPEGLDIAPFLLLESPFKNFEIGIPTPIDLSLTQVEDLWNEDNYNSLNNRKGISLWYEALTNANEYNALRSYFNLTINNIDTILNWLIFMRDNLTLHYTQLNYNLPADYYTLSEWYFTGILISGIVFSSLGIIVGGFALIYYRKKQ